VEVGAREEMETVRVRESGLVMLVGDLREGSGGSGSGGAGGEGSGWVERAWVGEGGWGVSSKLSGSLFGSWSSSSIVGDVISGLDIDFAAGVRG
jgi:hypothetical protein